jgi:hypothetical protein|eukprot:TRINITY_DN4953_c1_g1_i1.p1 TRINITY_DN4953_c1_g1~~TRINITY_DN4953_c1_g1_i1.p1  ORF type:complete len:103 (+),score=13.59 TRINITY_DN4953_c1_g1_i1:231-539(+)
MVKPSVINAEILERARLLNDATVTLYDWMANDVRDGRNLIATDRNGVELWRAKPVNYGDTMRQDCFTAIRWDGVNLTANTWSCYRVLIDTDTGKVTILEFTK